MICELEGCSTEFTPKNKTQKYCSPSHTSKAAYERLKKNAPRVECARAGCSVAFKQYDKRQKYCGHPCAAQVTNRSPNRKVWVDIKCNTCKKIFNGHPSRKFCSRKCSTSNRINKTESKVIEWIESGEGWSRADHTIPVPVRKYLLEEADNKCTKCGWGEPNPKLGKPILCIDHINGNWKDNRRDNLVVLCYNCHTLTPTFNALNIGNESGRRPGEGNRRPH